MEKATVLLVDDETALLNSLSKLLRVRGFQVKTVTNGKDAIVALGEEKFDVVVLDLKMPGMDGIQTLEKIKELGLLTEIMILTGHGSMNSALDAFNLGAYDYLTKPFELEDLLARIESAVRKKDVTEKRDMLDKMIRIRS